MEDIKRTDFSIFALSEVLKKISDKYYYFSREERIELMKYLADSSGIKEAFAAFSEQRSEIDRFSLIDERTSDLYLISMQKCLAKCDMILEYFSEHLDFAEFMESLKSI